MEISLTDLQFGMNSTPPPYVEIVNGPAYVQNLTKEDVLLTASESH